MRMMSVLALWLSVVAVLGVDVMADETRPAKGEWTGFTVDQIAEHLRLKGGNIDLRFESPVYLNVQAVVKEGADKPREITLDYWVSKPSTNYLLCFTVKDIDTTHRRRFEVCKMVSVKYTRIDRERIDEPGVTGYRTHDSGGGFGRTFTMATKRVGRLGAWQSNMLEAPVGTPITIYQLLDMDAPDDNFRKMIIQFTHAPPKNEQ